MKRTISLLLVLVITLSGCLLCSCDYIESIETAETIESIIKEEMAKNGGKYIIGYPPGILVAEIDIVEGKLAMAVFAPVHSSNMPPIESFSIYVSDELTDYTTTLYFEYEGELNMEWDVSKMDEMYSFAHGVSLGGRYSVMTGTLYYVTSNGYKIKLNLSE